jgi:hypothetical protein
MIGGVKAALLPDRRWCVVHAALIESESMTLATGRRGRNLADQLIGARIAECPLLLAQDDVGEHLTSFGLPSGQYVDPEQGDHSGLGRWWVDVQAS